jgi:hypothetical protein
MTDDSSPDADALETASGNSMDAVIEVYKRDVDRTLLLENLKLTVEERLLKAERVMEYVEELRAAGRRSRQTG